MHKIILLLTSFLLLWTSAAQAKVILGVERLSEPQVQNLLLNKRVGLFTNQSGVDSNLNSSVDLVAENSNLTAIFVPEHGLFGAVPAGENFEGSMYGNLPVFSLYGDSRYPNKAMLDKIDVMLVDIQDVGIRHYTYFSSLAYIMEECAKYKKLVIVLDRPNPLGGSMQGPVLKSEYTSFIGLYPLPLRHGLTIGEFANYINNIYKINCDLNIVKMKGYKRNMIWSDTNLPWVLTSPLIPTAETAFLYGITGVCGDSNLSVGVGTAQPFFLVGAPFVDAKKIKQALVDLNICGVKFRAAAFTPRYGIYKGELVQGVQVYIENIRDVNLPEVSYQILTKFRELYPQKIKFPKREYGAVGYKIDIALGEDSIRLGQASKDVFLRWNLEVETFKKEVREYLLYK